MRELFEYLSGKEDHRTWVCQRETKVPPLMDHIFQPASQSRERWDCDHGPSVGRKARHREKERERGKDNERNYNKVGVPPEQQPMVLECLPTTLAEGSRMMMDDVQKFSNQLSVNEKQELFRPQQQIPGTLWGGYGTSCSSY